MLLLGGDGGVGREGVRTDTVIVASIDTHTGDTTLFSLPRNLENLPFPPGSPLPRPIRTASRPAREEREPAQRRLPQRPGGAPRHPRPHRQPGRRLPQARRRRGPRPAHRLLRAGQPRRASAGWSTRSAASPSTSTTTCRSAASRPSSILPDAYIAPGPNQHMDGARALDFARGRYGLTDYLPHGPAALHDQGDRRRGRPGHPAAASTRSSRRRRRTSSAPTSRSRRSTTSSTWASGSRTPRSAASCSTQSLINPAYPDYDKIRRIVEPTRCHPPPATASSAGASSTRRGAVHRPPSTAATPSGAPPTTNPVTDVKDACAYDPAQAAAARAAGEPPTRRAEAAVTGGRTGRRSGRSRAPAAR